MLEVLCLPSPPPTCEAVESVELKFVSYKTVLLLALASLKRVSGLHALSVHLCCTQFPSDGLRVVLRLYRIKNRICRIGSFSFLQQGKVHPRTGQTRVLRKLIFSLFFVLF